MEKSIDLETDDPSPSFERGETIITILPKNDEHYVTVPERAEIQHIAGVSDGDAEINPNASNQEHLQHTAPNLNCIESIAISIPKQQESTGLDSVNVVKNAVIIKNYCRSPFKKSTDKSRTIPC
jgi:hypothetical protein